MTESEVPRTTDDEEIRALWAQACDAWTDGDAHAYGATFTADVDYVPYEGSLVRGRDAPLETPGTLFRGVLAAVGVVVAPPRTAGPRTRAHDRGRQDHPDRRHR
jgi:uncharacterized protein (TIGR02246 family)